ncbi:MAG: hypothetical protein KDA41_06420 [Planctomycetales bacterium]|nr:hypothetical protein [Planctomycetales bacterium]
MTQRVRCKRFGLVVWLLAAACGCGGPVTYEVTGSVAYDGEPVERGEINFVPTEPGAAAEGGLIENGRYSFRASPGAKRVEIRGSRPLPPERQTQPEMGLMYDDYIPAIYNRESKLTADVGPDSRQFDFDLPAP